MTERERQIYAIFLEHEMPYGRMISGSKSGYHKKHPNHDVLFNANIFTPKEGKIWYGDLDITIDCDVLQKICNEVGDEIIITSEMMGRFGAENKPYKEVKKYAHVRYTPNSNTYEKRQYSGFTGVTIDKMTVIISKPINWIKKKFNENL